MAEVLSSILGAWQKVAVQRNDAQPLVDHRTQGGQLEFTVYGRTDGKISTEHDSFSTARLKQETVILQVKCGQILALLHTSSCVLQSTYLSRTQMTVL